MSKILKNLLPFWKMVICILVLLCVQAFCDLSLPAYTSDIIDIGPDGGDRGGTIVAKGTPEEEAKNKKSYTGQYVKKYLK